MKLRYTHNSWTFTVIKWQNSWKCDIVKLKTVEIAKLSNSRIVETDNLSNYRTAEIVKTSNSRTVEICTVVILSNYKTADNVNECIKLYCRKAIVWELSINLNKSSYCQIIKLKTIKLWTSEIVKLSKYNNCEIIILENSWNC